MNRLLLLVFSTSVTISLANFNCFNGDILHKGAVKEPAIDDARGCRIQFELMEATCAEDKVDIVAGRTGSVSNETIECEYLTGDNMVECECASDKCNTPSMIVKDAIAAIQGADKTEQAVIDCFVKVLENKFGLSE